MSVFTALFSSATVAAMDIEDDGLEHFYEAFYKEHFTSLVETAMEQFEYSRSDAEKLVDEAFAVALFSTPRVVEIKSWLNGALTYAVRRTRSNA